MSAPRNPWLTLAIVSCALTMVGIDMTVLNVALPTLAHSLHATTSEKLWMVNAYSLVMAGLLPGFGALADKIGHRTILMIGLAVFGLASAAAAFSLSPGMLIAARAALGVGAALMLPATLATVRVVFHDDDHRALAIGIWGSVWAASGAVGPIFAGFLLEHFAWGSVFLINVPLVLVTLLLMALFVPHLPGDRTRRWDIPSSLLLTLSLMAVICGAKALLKPQPHWLEAFGAIVVGIITWRAFVRRQRGRANPLLDLRLFRNRHLSLGAGTALVSAFVLMGVQYILAQELQLVRGLTPLHAGLFVLPVAVGSFVAGPVLGKLIPSMGIEPLLSLSILAGTLGITAYALLGHGAGGMIEGVNLALIGFGIGGAMSVASTSIMMGAPKECAGQAGSIESLAYEVGGTMGVAIMGSIVATVYTRSFMPPPSPRLPAAAWDSLDQAIIAVVSVHEASARVVLEAAHMAFQRGIGATLIVAATCMIVLLGMTMSTRWILGR